MATGNELIDFTAFASRMRVRGVLLAETALRIGSGGTAGPTEHDLPTLKDQYGRPYIPGSSFKGAYRAHLERLLRGLDETLACPSTTRPRRAGALPGCLTQNDVDLLKADYKDDPTKLTREILHRSCWTCSLLGAPWLASKVSVRDLDVVPTTWFDRYLIRDGVAIDRDTETAAEGLKYDFEAVPSGTVFNFEMVIDNASPAELGLALLGLREFEASHVALGGAASRGLGRVHLELDWAGAEWLTAKELPAYIKGEAKSGRLADPAEREKYWQAFMKAITEAGKAGQHA